MSIATATATAPDPDPEHNFDHDVAQALTASTAAKEALYKAADRLRDATNAKHGAYIALAQAKEDEVQAIIDLPIKRKADNDASHALRQVKAARRAAFKDRVRAAGLYTTFFPRNTFNDNNNNTDDDASNNSADSRRTHTPTYSPTYSPTSPPPPDDSDTVLVGGGVE